MGTDMNSCIRSTFFLLLVVIAPATHAAGAVITYTNQTSWNNATGGNFTTIGFTGYPDSTLITNQYSNLGVTFLQPPPFVYPNDGFHDGWGAGSYPGTSKISMTFAVPMRWVGVLFPGSVQILLYSESQLIFSQVFDHGFSPFGGLISDTTFDKVVLNGPADCRIDDLFFGPSIPAPSSFALALAGLLVTRRRRNT